MFCRTAGTLIFHGKIHNFYFISIIRVQQFYIIVDIFYITFIDIFHKSVKVPCAFTFLTLALGHGGVSGQYNVGP